MQVDERTRDTLAAIRTLRSSIESGQPIDALDFSSLMDDIQVLVPTIPRSDIALLKSEVDAVIVLALEAKQNISDELKRLQNGRKGLDGYNHIRGYDTQQRLSRTA